MSDKNFLSGLNAKPKRKLRHPVDPGQRVKYPRTDVPQPKAEQFDVVNKARHYNTHPSGIECISIVEHMNFCLGSALKYIWRADEKSNAIEDLKKAAYYIAREIARREKAGAK